MMILEYYIDINYNVYIILFKNPPHSPNPNPREVGKEAKKVAEDEQCPDVDIQLRSEQQGCQPESRVLQRMTKAHSMVLANSR
jgi:hypothetical protein